MSFERGHKICSMKQNTTVEQYYYWNIAVNRTMLCAKKQNAPRVQIYSPRGTLILEAH